MNTVTQSKRPETAVDVPRKVIVMKNGLTFWVTEETGNRAQAQLEKQTAHSFMRIAELGETINTAEIAGVHSPETYEEMRRASAGDFKCQWGKWHGKKQVCECRAEAMRDARERTREHERQENERPLTPEEKAQSAENFRRMNERGALNGKPGSIFRNAFLKGKGRKIRRSTILDWETETGREADLEGLEIDEDVI